MRAPQFWNRRGVAAQLLRPLGMITAAATARRLAQRGADIGIPVICVGNINVGGTGKTPVTIAVIGGVVVLALGVLCYRLWRARRRVGLAKKSDNAIQIVPAAPLGVHDPTAPPQHLVGCQWMPRIVVKSVV